MLTNYPAAYASSTETINMVINRKPTDNHQYNSKCHSFTFVKASDKDD